MKIPCFYLSLYLNGSKYKLYVSQPVYISDILKFLNYQRELIIIEYNGKIYNSKNLAYKDQYLKKNDKIEIITVVGGG